MKKYKLYPDVEIERRGSTIEVRTTLRSLNSRDGKYYLNNLIINAVCRNETELIKRLMKDVYLEMIFGKVSPYLTDVDGNAIYMEDPDQTKELDRILIS